MPTVDLPQGRVNYRVAGPPGSPLPPVVFVHGILVNGEIWTGVAAALAERGIRSYAPDLPLGAHTPTGRRAHRRWVTRLLTDASVREDTARFMRGIRPADLVDVSTRLGRFTRPVLWGTGDRFFTLPLARHRPRDQHLPRPRLTLRASPVRCMPAG